MVQRWLIWMEGKLIGRVLDKLVGRLEGWKAMWARILASIFVHKFSF
jgi:hypothetical protein